MANGPEKLANYHGQIEWILRHTYSGNGRPIFGGIVAGPSNNLSIELLQVIDRVRLEDGEEFQCVSRVGIATWAKSGHFSYFFECFVSKMKYRYLCKKKD